MTTRATEKRSKADDASIIGAQLRPFFSRLAIHEIASDHIERYKRAKAANAPLTVRNHLSLLGTMLRRVRRPLIRLVSTSSGGRAVTPTRSRTEDDRADEGRRRHVRDLADRG
jgi:hypothetical protein